MGNKKEYDILMKFTFDDLDYVIVTDNTYDEEGNFNVFGARVGDDERLIEVDDIDIQDIFDIMINKYKEKVWNGEL